MQENSLRAHFTGLSGVVHVNGSPIALRGRELAFARFIQAINAGCQYCGITNERLDALDDQFYHTLFEHVVIKFGDFSPIEIYKALVLSVEMTDPRFNAFGKLSGNWVIACLDSYQQRRNRIRGKFEKKAEEIQTMVDYVKDYLENTRGTKQNLINALRAICKAYEPMGLQMPPMPLNSDELPKGCEWGMLGQLYKAMERAGMVALDIEEKYFIHAYITYRLKEKARAARKNGRQSMVDMYSNPNVVAIYSRRLAALINIWVIMESGKCTDFSETWFMTMPDDRTRAIVNKFSESDIENPDERAMYDRYCKALEHLGYDLENNTFIFEDEL